MNVIHRSVLVPTEDSRGEEQGHRLFRRGRHSCGRGNPGCQRQTAGFRLKACRNDGAAQNDVPSVILFKSFMPFMVKFGLLCRRSSLNRMPWINYFNERHSFTGIGFKTLLPHKTYVQKPWLSAGLAPFYVSRLQCYQAVAYPQIKFTYRTLMFTGPDDSISEIWISSPYPLFLSRSINPPSPAFRRSSALPTRS